MYGRTRRPWVLLLLLALLIASCGPGHTPQPAARILPSVPPNAPLSVGDDLITPLPGGPAAFAAVESVLQSAARSIDLEMYEFQRPDLAGLMLSAHARGVAVTGILDPSEGSSQSTWALLAQAGIRLVAFPVEPLTIDHVKLLIVDGSRAVLGGINWGRHSVENRDYDVLVTGPAVRNLTRIFEQDLELAGNPTPVASTVADPLIQVLVTRPGDAIRGAAVSAIDSAQRTIDIEMFVLSDRIVIDALLAAARRGVQVRVLLEPTQPQNLAALAELRSAGARAQLFKPARGELLHAKLAIIDAVAVLFGSCNWSRSGFTRNHELDLLIRDATVARVFLDRLQVDWSGSAN
ncbi:MAG: phosphatidylserine/phosphatidylglycerophosphate/cardiolipin synthase family protein [Chloroflexi bacterium]|nr:MAG: phosphatidylserine/phosphatidylglycerophosphate/cardiolipin synthase family protein [Chloroflexota bacterium]